MVIRTSFWPLGGQSETDPYDPGKVFFEVNEPTSPYVWENDIEAGTYRLRLGARAAITGRISAPTAAAAAPVSIPNLNCCQPRI